MINANYQFDFHSEVKAELDEAYYWYETKQTGLGEQFLIHVLQKLERILAMPETYSVNIESNTGRQK